MYLEIVRGYWIFLPIAIFREGAVFLSLFSHAKECEMPQRTFWKARMWGLLKTHILIFVLAFLVNGKSGGFIIYAVVSAIYFFPWEVFVKLNDKTKTTDFAETRKKASEKIANESAQRKNLRKNKR